MKRKYEETINSNPWIEQALYEIKERVRGWHIHIEQQSKLAWDKADKDEKIRRRFCLKRINKPIFKLMIKNESKLVGNEWFPPDYTPPDLSNIPDIDISGISNSLRITEDMFGPEINKENNIIKEETENKEDYINEEDISLPF